MTVLSSHKYLAILSILKNRHSGKCPLASGYATGHGLKGCHSEEANILNSYMANAEWPTKNHFFTPPRSHFFKLRVRFDDRCRFEKGAFSVANAPSE